MKMSSALQTAVSALRRNYMRAVLTALGIIIGIAAVIAMMEIGEGSSSAIARTIASMGANIILVQPGTAASGGITFGAGSVTTLTADDSDAILRESLAISNSAPIVRAKAQLVYQDKNWVPATINGTIPSFLDVRDWGQLSEGTVFSDRDVRNGNRVCLIGATIVRELFGGNSPIGKELRVQNVSFRVIGVLSRKGANMMGMDQDDILLAPWTTIKYRISGVSTSTTTSSTSSSGSSSTSNSTSSLYPATSVELYPEQSSSSDLLSKRIANVDQILVSAKSSESVAAAVKQITAILRERHHIRPGEAEDFNIRDMAEMTKALSSTTALMTKLLLCVALISLVVGGVGIMNIMLVSVTERTHEIGLRMAVGARGRDIMQQFLIEAVVLCLAGGIIGVISGIGVSKLVNLLLGWPVESSLIAVVAAFCVSVSVGIIFGYYPAWKASKLDPIEALHYE